MLLTLALFLPLVGVVAVLLCPKEKLGLIRWTSVGFAIATFIPVALLCLGYAGGGADSVAEVFQGRVQQAIAAAPADIREDIRSLLKDPVSNSPALLDFKPGAKGPLSERDKALSRAKKTLARVREGGGYEAWHTAWELSVAQVSAGSKGMKYVVYADWIPAFHIHYFLGVDGLSLPLIFLTALLWILCFVYSLKMEKALKGYFALFLLLEFALLGVFMALDFFLFYVTWEIVLLPMYFLIGIWGGPRRIYAAIKFFIYTLLGSVLMLVAMLALYWHGGFDTFNILTLTGMSGSFSSVFQMWIFWGLFLGFAVKVPVFPFHTWLPDAHVQAPTAVSVVLAGVLLKMGGYGFFRFNYMLTPGAMRTEIVVTVVALLGLINIIYGALCAMGQKDFKSLVAYSSISHMGFVLLGMAALTPEGVQGAVLQMFNHGVTSALMFLLVGVLYDRAHHRDLDKFGGIGLQMPYYTGFAIIGFFAAMGLPGLNGFISEFATLTGSFRSATFFAGQSAVFGLPRWIVYLALPVLVLTAGYILWMVQRVYLGRPKKEEYKSFKDLDAREVFVLAPLAALCILIGVYPSIITDYMGPTLESLRLFVTQGR